MKISKIETMAPEQTDITSFYGEYRWLSNFWKCTIELDGIIYPSVENAYQACKVSKEEREPFTTCTPIEAKRLGRKVLLPKDWEQRKLGIMKSLVYKKFRYNKDLAIKLLETNDKKIVEDNPFGDIFWGVHRGHGENHLGRIIMEVRDELMIRKEASIKRRNLHLTSNQDVNTVTPIGINDELKKEIKTLKLAEKVDQVFSTEIVSEKVDISVIGTTIVHENIYDPSDSNSKNYAVCFQEFGIQFKIYCYDQKSAETLNKAIRENAIYATAKKVQIHNNSKGFISL